LNAARLVIQKHDAKRRHYVKNNNENRDERKRPPSSLTAAGRLKTGEVENAAGLERQRQESGMQVAGCRLQVAGEYTIFMVKSLLKSINYIYFSGYSDGADAGNPRPTQSCQSPDPDAANLNNFTPTKLTRHASCLFCWISIHPRPDRPADA
jgi:hypothetical protein